MHFIVLSADTAGLSQTQGCHSADVQSVSQCSEDRAGVCLIQTAVHLSEWPCSDSHGHFYIQESQREFAVWGEWGAVLCTVGHSQERLTFVPSGKYFLATEDALLTLCSLAENISQCMSFQNISPRVQTGWDCWHRAGFLTFTKLSSLPISSIPGKQNSKTGGRLVL